MPTSRKPNERTVWVCTSGTEYESSSVRAVYADVHGGRSWLSRERHRAIRGARKWERSVAQLEERPPDYSNIASHPLSTDVALPESEGFSCGDRWWQITPWTVTP
jgi:hypothetical protein